jgi:hypothetical protein
MRYSNFRVQMRGRTPEAYGSLIIIIFPTNAKHRIIHNEVKMLLFLLVFILTANGVLPGGSGNTIRHNTKITHITQNNTTIKRNTAHKTTHTIKDTLHTMNKNNHNHNCIN